jgi:hypothetical protein
LTMSGGQFGCSRSLPFRRRAVVSGSRSSSPTSSRRIRGHAGLVVHPEFFEWCVRRLRAQGDDVRRLSLKRLDARGRRARSVFVYEAFRSDRRSSNDGRARACCRSSTTSTMPCSC